jgi:probable DNA metabolism protein
MVTVLYDGTFEGFLSAVFDVYEYKLNDARITTANSYQPTAFDKYHESYFHEKKSSRVWKGLSAKVSAGALRQLYKTFLSEEPRIEDILLNYAQYVFKSNRTVEYDLTHPAVLKVTQMAKIVHRESHRMEAFVRFQLTADKLYYAIVQPDFNVLPLIEKHFKDRYADQYWLIFDSRRKYGIYYNLEKVETVNITFNEETNSGQDLQLILDEKETLYQQLWQQYFVSVNIKARKNTKLHIQHMPKRYWKYLPEKQPPIK